ncbi:L-ribulose-5-phosphate 4-epimerase [Parvularcula dongshanensis]|uniref:L-ribulose-5-phosphate 4-epimerase n=1 Tax=Parvularcula dongshanensis TaxID=1173995 RepID=A0A840I543_9PROT|nr:L-ribulose-5-phosphate 4-epimerase [Parvularcula dongshanensis]MBB4659959.1 L-ribulose-5-phosphate 4-epimerase [Parvularcula dongshanensis]
MASLRTLKEEVYEANLALVRHGLVLLTWGNVSGIDRDQGLVAIKPSGVPYDDMTADDMVIVDLDGKVVEGTLKPSSDTATHLVLYNRFEGVGGVAHTHSTHGAAYAQAGRPIKILGTTQADYFADDIPCTRDMTKEEIEGAFEHETGNVIVETVGNRDPLHVPGVLLKNHAPFTWGKTAAEAVRNSVVLEEVARMGLMTAQLNPQAEMNQHLVKKHFERKHGPNAYYGQGGPN